MLFVLCILCFKLHKTYDYMYHERKEGQFNRINNLKDDDFIYPSDKCQSIINETDFYEITNCTFEDCIEDDYLIIFKSNTSSFTIRNCSFQFTDHHKSSSIVFSTAPTLQIIESFFKNCNNNTIHYQKIQDSYS